MNPVVFVCGIPLIIIGLVWLGSSIHWNSKKGGVRILEKGSGFVRVVHQWEKTKLEASIYGSTKRVEIDLNQQTRNQLLSWIKEVVPFELKVADCQITGEALAWHYLIRFTKGDIEIELWLNRGELNWLHQTLQTN